MHLDRVGLKVHFREGAGLPLEGFLPVFHRWIQTSALEGGLIDVADYSHMRGGPGVILVAHEGIYGIDETLGRRGLVYYGRRPEDLGADRVLESVARHVFSGCVLLEREPEFSGKIGFAAGDLEFFVNDRLRAPNDDTGYKLVEPPLKTLLARLYSGATCRLERSGDPRDRLSIRVHGPADAQASQVLARLR
jgi:hypothetical protein